MVLFLGNVLLALVWVALTGRFSGGNLLLGFGVGFVALLALRRRGEAPDYFDKLPQALSFLAFYLRELVLANLRVAQVVIHPRPRILPGVVAIPLDVRSDAEITLLANLITLTPGTLSLDVSSDRKVLYVHGMDIPDREEFRRSVKDGFERRVIELLR